MLFSLLGPVGQVSALPAALRSGRWLSWQVWNLALLVAYSIRVAVSLFMELDTVQALAQGALSQGLGRAHGYTTGQKALFGVDSTFM